MPPKLWTKNFTIITVGSLVSIMGNVVAGFAISLMVLDYTQSVFLFTFYIVIYNLPKLVMPLIMGPYLDRFSRKRVIYSLDFLSSALYLGMFVLTYLGWFSYGPFLLICALIGAIDSTYLVAYDSLYPTLVDKENFRQAYSIASMLSNLSVLVGPIAAFAYEKLGSSSPLFLFNAGVFLVSAIFKTRIDARESHITGATMQFSLSSWIQDFKAGLRYIKAEPGLLVITSYFFFVYIGDGATALTMPYFKATPGLGVMAYTLVLSGGVIGRILGAGIQYRFKFPSQRKLDIARWVYLITTVLTGVYLFMPTPLTMAVTQVFIGLMGVTSYNIRIASTQTYVPNSHRARFNGSFQMVTNLGLILGQLVCGALGDFLPIRGIFLTIMGIQLTAYVFTMGSKGKLVRPIYNMDM